MSSPSRKCEGGVSPRFHLVVNQVVNQGVWCKLKEMRGRGVQDSPMVESFSADLPAIESYWKESHLEFCRISTTEFLCESMWSAFR